MLENIQEIDNAIKLFLQAELDAEVEKELKKSESSSEQALQKKQESLYKKLQPNYEYSFWISKVFESIHTMQNHKLSFATHTAKGIHSALRTENVIFFPSKELPVHLVGMQSISDLMIDANSNNPGGHTGYLKDIVGFANIEIGDTRIYKLIQTKHSIMLNYFEKHNEEESFDYLHELLNKKPLGKETDGRNKQVLFHQGDDKYICLIPLYPTSITHYVYRHINNIKYSETNVKARKNRRENKDAIPYCDMLNLAVTILGGTHSNNVSRLNNIQGGLNYLLPSLPPKMAQSREFALSKFAENFFHSKTLKYHIHDDFEYVIQVVKDARNNVNVRDKRKDAIDRMLHTIFAIAHTLQEKSAGWSKDYALPFSQKVWLDPYRADLDGEEEFAQHKAQNEWQKEILDDFASWFNSELREQFQNLKYDIADAEFIEWKREIEEMQGFYQRMGKGIFL